MCTSVLCVSQFGVRHSQFCLIVDRIALRVLNHFSRDLRFFPDFDPKQTSCAITFEMLFVTDVVVLGSIPQWMPYSLFISKWCSEMKPSNMFLFDDFNSIIYDFTMNEDPRARKHEPTLPMTISVYRGFLIIIVTFYNFSYINNRYARRMRRRRHGIYISLEFCK